MTVARDSRVGVTWAQAVVGSTMRGYMVCAMNRVPFDSQEGKVGGGPSSTCGGALNIPSYEGPMSFFAGEEKRKGGAGARRMGRGLGAPSIL
mmetsp:Transcript_6990/g.13875  ORF Transcript_6990/g.13875 Transcript_6990/m.13875 type:complete len:92 (-) Transcript_6990:626-901(-)